MRRQCILTCFQVGNDQEYLEYHIRGLGCGTADLGNFERPCGNDPDIIQVVQAGRKLQGYCDAIGELKMYIMNIMNDNEQTSIWDDTAKEGHFGAYLLSSWNRTEALANN